MKRQAGWAACPSYRRQEGSQSRRDTGGGRVLSLRPFTQTPPSSAFELLHSALEISMAM